MITWTQRFGEHRTLGSTLLLLAAAAWMFGHAGLLLALSALAVHHLKQWFDATRHLRLTEDTATARIASAAQGHVELCGAAQSCDGRVLRDPITREACVWFRVETYRTRGWLLRRLVKQAQSTRAFDLDDGSGRCRITPASTTFALSRPLRFGNRFGLHHDLFVVFPGETAHARGYFRTQTAADNGQPIHQLSVAPDGQRCVVSHGTEAQTLDTLRKAARDRAVITLCVFAASVVWWLLGRG